MSEESSRRADFVEMPPPTSEFRRFIRVILGRRLVMFGLIVVLALIVTAILAPVLAPYDPYEINLGKVLLQPCWEHPAGTDTLGRDTLSRIIYGARTSLIIGLVATGFAALSGMTLGLVAGYFGGTTFRIIMRITDAFMCFPALLIAIVFGAVLGLGLKNVVIAIGISMVPGYIRLMCAQVLTVKENDYVTAGRATGASNLRIMLSHIVPNSLPPLIVAATLIIGHAIMAEAALSFLGIGIASPGAAWGAMVAEGYKHLMTLPILSFAPGLAIMVTVFAFNMVGDGLRDAYDPRLRGTL